MKQGIDEKLAERRRQLDDFNRRPIRKGSSVTPDAASALFDLVKRLPRVVGQSLSGADERVGSAHHSMEEIQRCLKEAGIKLNDRFTVFPDRLAELCRPGVAAAAAEKADDDRPSNS